MEKTTRRSAVRRTLHAAAAMPFMPHLSFAAEGKSGPIKVAQIGVAHAHATKLSVYRNSGDYEVVGIVEPDEALRKNASQHSAFRNLPFMTQDELLNMADVQAVLVETEIKRSLDVAEACIAAGKHIHLDKPAGESLSHYKRILASAEQQGLLMQMGYMYRYNPAVIVLREFLNKGWLGDVFEVHTVMSKVVPPAGRAELEQYPGGIMFELACHIIDLTIGVLGAPDSVTAFPRHSSDIKDTLVDNMLAVFEYPKATATVKSSAVEVEGFARRHFVVCGTKGTFHIQPLDRPSARVALSEARGDFKKGYQDVSFPKFDRYVADAADMAKVIRGEKPSDFSYQHDLNVQTAVLQASAAPTK